MFEIKFSTENAAFDEHLDGQPNGAIPEIARILRNLATRIESDNFDNRSPQKFQNILDINGNIVGTARWTRR